MRAESELYKTGRWFEINPKAKDHPEQIRLTNDLMSGANRYFTIVAGRRSFKTERFAKRFPIVYALSHPDQIIHFGAPVRHQAKDIFWNDLLKLVHPNYIFSKSISELTITLHNKTQLQVIGLKEFARKEGTLCNLAVFSEFQHCDVEVFTQSYQPMLIDTNGIGIFEGRPHELNHLYDFYLRGKNGDKGWGSYHWESEGILTDDQIQQAKRDLTEVDYRREFKADFFTLGQRPYYAFDELSIKPFKINYELPFIITCDFNATEKPMSWVLGQRVQEKFQRGYLPVTYWIKTFAHQYTNTASMCEIVDEWIKTNLDYYPKQIFFYGDYAGVKKTSNSSFSDWDIITKYFNNKAKIDLRIKPTQSVRDSIAATNAQFKNALGERRQFVTSKDLHTTLIDDFYKCSWKSNGTELEDKDDMRGHACFDGDTLIATMMGTVEIRKIKEGDYVITSSGVRKVSACGITSFNESVFEYSFSNGTKLISTEEHPIFTYNGQIPISLLSPLDIIVIFDYNKMEMVWKRMSLFIMAIDMLDSLILKIGQRVITIRQAQKEKIIIDCINKFILMLSGKFLLVIMSITKTVMLLITTYLILWRSKRQNIYQIIQRLFGKNNVTECLNQAGRILNLHNQHIKSGLKRIVKCCPKGRKGNGEKESQENSSVMYADMNILPKTLTKTKNIVQENATQNNDATKRLILNKGIVNTVGENLKQINISDRNIVQEAVVRLPDGVKKSNRNVYSLTVEKDHNYFANGILVSNCRSIDYFNDYETPIYGNEPAKVRD